MRTTVTLDPDTEAMIKKLMRERGLTFKQALNEAIRKGLGSPRRTATRTPTFRMGFEPAIPLDRALRLAGEMEDEEIARKLATKK